MNIYGVQLLLIVALSSTSCSDSGMVEVRDEYWKSQIEILNQTKPGKSYVLKKYKDYLSSINIDENNVLLQETVETRGFACNSWHFVVEVEYSDNGDYVNASYVNAGTCL